MSCGLEKLYLRHIEGECMSTSLCLDNRHNAQSAHILGPTSSCTDRETDTQQTLAAHKVQAVLKMAQNEGRCRSTVVN